MTDKTSPLRRVLLTQDKLIKMVVILFFQQVVVTVVQVSRIERTLARAQAFGAPFSETVTDVTPEGVPFSEAMITSPGGHAILVYQVGESSEP